MSPVQILPLPAGAGSSQTKTISSALIFMKQQTESDQILASRKEDHIALAFKARTELGHEDVRFDYEPMLAAHPQDADLSTSWAGHALRYPVWISSMTGGTERALHINTNLAKLCGEFGLGMGLGSCRSLLEGDARLADFDMRPHMEGMPLYANLGIAQVEELCREGKLDQLVSLVDRLRADGLIIHINPLQEWAQEEGDAIVRPPIDTVQQVVESIDTPIIVKEVGQGMGPASLRALMKLPVRAIEFGASGGTNFTKLELQRRDDDITFKERFGSVGHTANEMVRFVNEIMQDGTPLCTSFIISGGVTDYLHGYYLMENCLGDSIYGQASAFLKQALGDYDTLRHYFIREMKGLAMAKAYLKARPI